MKVLENGSLFFWRLENGLWKWKIKNGRQQMEKRNTGNRKLKSRIAICNKVIIMACIGRFLEVEFRKTGTCLLEIQKIEIRVFGNT